MSDVISDSYQTFAKPATGIFKEKGSKFISHGYQVSSEARIKEIIKEIKKEYHDARHHCYAYSLGPDQKIYRVNDDGEPSGTAGKPIYGQIISNNLSDVLIIVVRYFGGTLLGTSGLINAYKTAANDCIAQASLIKKYVSKKLKIQFGYDMLNLVMRIIKEFGIVDFEQKYEGTECNFQIYVRLSDFNKVMKRFENTYGVEVL